MYVLAKIIKICCKYAFLEYEPTEAEIKDIKDRIFKILINEGNVENEQIWIDFYQYLKTHNPEYNISRSKSNGALRKGIMFKNQDIDDEFVQNAFEPKIDK